MKKLKSIEYIIKKKNIAFAKEFEKKMEKELMLIKHKAKIVNWGINVNFKRRDICVIKEGFERAFEISYRIIMKILSLINN